VKYLGVIFDKNNYMEITYRNDRRQEPTNIYWHLPSSERWTLKRQHKINPQQSID